MATSPSVFSFAHIVRASTITAAIALLVLVVQRSRFKMLRLSDCLLAGCGRGPLSHRVAVGRQYRGIEQRSHSRSESRVYVLCPLVTYLFIGFYAAFLPPLNARRFEQTRVLLTLVAFVVNVVTI